MDRQLSLLLIKFHEQFLEPPIGVPIEITKIIADGVIAVIGELDRLSARAASSFAAGGTFGAAVGGQLELFELAQQRRREEEAGVGSHKSIETRQCAA